VIQSAVYGAAVPAGSVFAILQSVGATATIVPAVVAAAAAAGTTAASGDNNDQQPDEAGEVIFEATDDEPTTDDSKDPEKNDCENIALKHDCWIPVVDPGLSQDGGNDTMNGESGGQDLIRPRNNTS
jgi:hypothetical protein